MRLFSQLGHYNLFYFYFWWEREGIRHAPSRLSADVEDSIRARITLYYRLQITRPSQGPFNSSFGPPVALPKSSHYTNKDGLLLWRPKATSNPYITPPPPAINQPAVCPQSQEDNT